MKEKMECYWWLRAQIFIFLPSNPFQDNMKIQYLYLPCNLSGLFQFWIRISNSIHILFRAIGTLAWRKNFWDHNKKKLPFLWHKKKSLRILHWVTNCARFWACNLLQSSRNLQRLAVSHITARMRFQQNIPILVKFKYIFLRFSCTNVSHKFFIVQEVMSGHRSWNGIRL